MSALLNNRWKWKVAYHMFPCLTRKSFHRNKSLGVWMWLRQRLLQAAIIWKTSSAFQDNSQSWHLSQLNLPESTPTSSPQNSKSCVSFGWHLYKFQPSCPSLNYIISLCVCVYTYIHVFHIYKFVWFFPVYVWMVAFIEQYYQTFREPKVIWKFP